MMVTLQYGVLWNSYIKPANLDDDDDITIRGIIEQIHKTS